MALVSKNLTSIDPTGAKGAMIQPIQKGVAVLETPQQTDSGGFFGWLDNVGASIGDAAGRAVDVVANDWINDLNESNNNSVKTPDSTPVKADNQLPVDKSFFEANKQYIIWGGVALVGVAALVLAFKKK